MFYCFIVTAAWLVWHIGFRTVSYTHLTLPTK